MKLRAHVAIALPLLALAACFRGALPPRELYRLRLPDPPAAAARGPLPGTLAVAPYQAPGLYGESPIVFRVGDTEYGQYPSREWALPLATQLGLLTESVLRGTPVTTGEAVFDPPSSRAQTYVWRGAVRELEEVNRGRALSAAVRLDAVLVRSADDSIVWTGSVRLERAVPAATMPAVVETLSALAAEAVTQLAREAAAAVGGRRMTTGQ